MRKKAPPKKKTSGEKTEVLQEKNNLVARKRKNHQEGHLLPKAGK